MKAMVAIMATIIAYLAFDKILAYAGITKADSVNNAMIILSHAFGATIAIVLIIKNFFKKRGDKWYATVT